MQLYKPSVSLSQLSSSQLNPDPLQDHIRIGRLTGTGLGALGMGWYQFIFACQNNRALFVATIPLRIVYAFVVARIAGWDAVAYELCVWALANCAAYLQVDSDPRSRVSTKNKS